jgi:predicted MFS family arabinose efflux permease
MMDRLGTRRVVLWLGGAAAVTPLLFPALPWVWAAIVLQMIGGLASNYGWIGAQAQIGEVMKGSPIYAGRLSFSVRIGQLLGPPLAGLSWDLGGPWAAFAVMALWGTGMFAASFWLPGGDSAESRTPVHARDLVPRWSDYIAAFRMLAAPAILLVIMVTALRMAGNGIQSSFYVVYLEGIGYSGTLIGVAMGAAGVLGFAGALSVGPLIRLVRLHWLLLVAVACSIFFVAITPLIGGFFFLLIGASALRGGALGLSQPLMISILSKAAGTGNQGKGVALRTTSNRVISAIIPILMGAVVELTGIETGFYIIGLVLLSMVGLTAVYAKRTQGT